MPCGILHLSLASLINSQLVNLFPMGTPTLKEAGPTNMKLSAGVSSAGSVVLFVLLGCMLVPGVMAQPNVQGQWSTLPYTAPINPVHVALLYTGKVLIEIGRAHV